MSASTPNTAPEGAVHVAVGVISDSAGRILIAQRPEGSQHAGEWEFPGGKLLPGESVNRALRRELHEELGIDVLAAHPLIQLRHAYPEKAVYLDVWRITRFSGEPRARERQVIAWVAAAELTSYNFLAANRPIISAARLPSFYLITDMKRFGGRQFLPLLERAVKAGARLVQLREPHLPPAEYLALAREVCALCHEYSASVLLNAEPEWVAECGADGVHLTSQRLSQTRGRPLPGHLWVAASCHDAAELTAAARYGTDFAVLSPVLHTTSHPGATPLGWEKFSELSANANLPVYALGGLGAGDLERARLAGAQGLAMISGAWGAPSLEAVIAACGR